jgi:iron complex outermembrane receptor protein
MNWKHYLLTASTALVPASLSFAQDGEDAAVEEIVVTGSRIVRSDNFEEAGHVIPIDEIAIEAMAELNMADVLRSSPLNSHGSFNERSGNSAQSNATINLRGLGDWRTLVLVDGTRVPGSPNLAAQSVNINMLPNVAVRRIDILADGASAVYGSDAMAGVVNFVLHRDFEGIELSARYGDRSRDDGGDQSYGLLAGVSGDKGNVVMALEYSHRDEIYDRDRWYTAPQILDNDGNGRPDIYGDTVGISWYGRTWEIFDPVTGHYELRAAADCPDTNGFAGVMYGGAWGLPDDTVCSYAYSEVSANRAELEKVNGYVYADYEISDDAELYVRGMFAKNHSFGRYAPPAAQWPSPPADHPHNPFDLDAMIAQGVITDQAELWGYYRWTNVGPRDGDTMDFMYDIVAGIKGGFGDSGSYEFYAQSARYDASDFGNYYLSFIGLDYVLANQLDPFSPLGTAAMQAQTTQINFTTQDKLYAHMQMDAWDIFGAGNSIALFGAEYAEVDYENKLDPGSEAGFVGGSAGISNGGVRNIGSVFVEYFVPVTENGEMNLAGRYDDYSDFGGTFNPSVGYVHSITDSLTLRARWGEGFVAPDMVSLYGPSSVYNTIDYDPVIDAFWGFTVYDDFNPALQPETSSSISAGLSWEYLEGHSVDLTYYSIEIDNVIVWPDSTDLLYADSAGVTWDPTGVRVERDAAGRVEAVYLHPVNANKQEASGLDLLLNSTFDTRFGFFDLRAFYSYQLSFKENAFFRGGYQDTRNYDGRPDTRAQVSVSWNYGDHAAHIVGNYIGRHAADEEFDPENGLISRSPEMYDDWLTTSVSYGYDAKSWGVFRIGANNVFDEDPVINPVWDEPGPSDLYDKIGRVIFVEYKKTFD